MNKYRLENISFYKDDIDEAMKIVKIKGAFSCDDAKAKEILDLIDSKSYIEIEDTEVYSNMIRFGLNANMRSLERIKFLEDEEKKRIAFQENIRINKPLAEAWYNNLSEEEQNFVDILHIGKLSAS